MIVHRFLIVFFFIVLFVLSEAQPSFEWGRNKQFSVSSYGYRSSYCRYDNSVIVSGNFVGPYHEPDSNDMGGFVQKYNASGKLLWEKVFYSKWRALRTLNAVDSSGNIFLSGSYSGNMQYEDSMFNGSGMFFLKYDPNGVLLLSFQEPQAFATTMCIDRDKNILIAGTFNTDNDSVFHGQPFKHGTFLAKYDKNGNFLWVKDFFCYGYFENAFDMNIDEQGFIYTTGVFSQYGDQSFTDNVQLVNTGDLDGFIAKYDEEVNLQWVKTITGPNAEVLNSIAVSPKGEIFVGGYYSSSASYYVHHFDSITINGNVNNGGDVFLAKYSPSGKCQWVKIGEGDGADELRDVYVDDHSNVFIVGYYGFYGGDISFDDQELISSEHYSVNAFLVVYNSNGDLLWARGSDGGGEIKTLCGDGSDDLYISGQFGGNFGFSPVLLSGNDEMFLIKVKYDDNVIAVVETKNVKLGIDIYPNPNSGVFFIKCPSDMRSEIQINIRNTLGQNVYSALIQKSESDRKIYLSQDKGIYVAEIIDGSEKIYKKIIVD